jgi:hypothetical protein
MHGHEDAALGCHSGRQLGCERADVEQRERADVEQRERAEIGRQLGELLVVRNPDCTAEGDVEVSEDDVVSPEPVTDRR